MSDLEQIEIALLLEGIHRHYGYDFRGYAPASIRRRVARRMLAEGLPTVSALQALVLHNQPALERLLTDLSVNVTAMFRDPTFYAAFRAQVVPILRTYPFIRIWHAGCSTGEEVYSMAILLREEGLYDRARLYGTDMNAEVLSKARSRIFPLKAMQEYTQNYLQAGGKRSFSEYYTARYEGAVFDASLLENVVFSQHNLVTDRSFNEFHVIICRNVMIYFDRPLQDQVHDLFYRSLVPLGVLCLGNRESMKFSSLADLYDEIDLREKIYRRRG